METNCKKLPRNKRQTAAILARIAACKLEKEAKIARKVARATRKVFNPPRII